jgi:predicted KAP-like P-loop ATPase
MAHERKPTTYLSDYWTLQDDLRFSDFRPALKNILIQAQTSLTVGIFGPWGSGKTSLLRMLKQEIEKESGDSIRTVWFTAWKYIRHEALWRAFILEVLAGLFQNPQGLNQEQEEMLRRIEESLYHPVNWQELGQWTINWWQMLKESGKGAAEIAVAFLPGAKLFKKLSEVLGGDKKADAELEKAVAAINREVRNYHREQLESMEQFESTFREALELVLGEQGRLIVFVDDLDRCLPEKAVEVLEAIKLFLEVPGTVFVLGMDQEVIEKGTPYPGKFVFAEVCADSLSFAATCRRRTETVYRISGKNGAPRGSPE